MLTTVLPAPVSASHLRAIATGLAAAESLWRPHVAHHAEDRGRVRLIATEVYEVWVLGWLDGQSVELHDHGPSAAAFTVVDGTLVEVTLEDGRLVRRRLTAGDTRSVPVGTVHDVVHPGGAPATSIHAYSPPLSSMGYYDPVTFTRARVDAVAVETPRLSPSAVTLAAHPAGAARR